MAKRRPLSHAETLETFLDRLIEDNVFQTHRQIALECGMKEPVLSLVLTDPRRRLTVEQCLRLARRANVHPPNLLRVAGRTEAADVVEELWPQAQKKHFTRKECELIDRWRQLSLRSKHAVFGMCVELAAAATAGTDGGVRGGSARTSRARRTR
jgi:hypothetical protein